MIRDMWIMRFLNAAHARGSAVGATVVHGSPHPQLQKRIRSSSAMWPSVGRHGIRF
jgi:hypothetical protein